MGKRNIEFENKLCEYISNYIELYSTSPTVRELASYFDCSPNNIQQYMKRLEQENKIERRGTRNIILPPSMEYLGIPIVGTVACGPLNFAEEHVTSYVPIFKNGFGKDEYYALYAKGESMIDAGICDGDLIIIKKTNIARDGDIVVALVEDETTLKRFYKEKNYIRLHPENKELDDIIVPNCIIQGVAVKVIKDL